MRAGLEGLDGFTIEDAAGRRLEACQSPVWDTALAVTALADAGLPPDDPSLRTAAQWLLAEEITVPGDWQTSSVIPTVVDGVNTVTVPLSSSAREYFRLDQ